MAAKNKGKRKEKIKKLVGGADAIRNPVNSLIDDVDDHDDRICELEKASGGEPESTIAEKDGVFWYVEIPMRVIERVNL